MSGLLPYQGAKRGLLKQIVPLLPKEFGDYHEPFLGSGSLLCYLAKTGRLKGAVYGAERLEWVRSIWLAARDAPLELIAQYRSAMALWNEGDKSGESFREIAKLSDGAAIWARSHSFLRTGSTPDYKSFYDGKDLLRRDDILAVNRVSPTIFGDFDEMPVPSQNSLVFLDPPYFGSDCNRYGGWGSADVERLRGYILRAVLAGAFVCLTENLSNAPLYNELLPFCYKTKRSHLLSVDDGDECLLMSHNTQNTLF